MNSLNDVPDERARVRRVVSPLIFAYRDERGSKPFHIEDLRQYVYTFVPSGSIAPDSPGRALREMRQDGLIDYIVINRRQSLYQFIIDEEEPSGHS